MACYHPMHVQRDPEDGSIIWDVPRALRNGEQLVLACGQCSGCRLEYARQWAVRNMHEKQTSNRSCYVTLTYDDHHLPPRGGLRIRDWQDFARRVRSELGSFRYFHCGEYGEKRGRAHLHGLIYGLDFKSDRKYLKRTDQGHTLEQSALLDELWGKAAPGQNPIGNVTFESACYVSRYIMKKLNGKRGKRAYGRIEVTNTTTGEVTEEFYRHPPYVTMSLKPGIGHAWIHKHMDEVYKHDEVIINGVPTRPPKYYDLEYEKVNPEGYAALLEKRKKEAQPHRHNNTPARLQTREEVHRRHSQHFKRDAL